MKSSLLGLIVLVVVVLVLLYFISSGVKAGFTGSMGETNSRGTFVMYYADWCPHCQTAKPLFQEFMQNGTVTVDGKTVKCAMKEEKEIKKGVDPDIAGYPTFLYTDAAGRVVNYDGPRTADGFMQFLKQQVLS